MSICKRNNGDGKACPYCKKIDAPSPPAEPEPLEGWALVRLDFTSNDITGLMSPDQDYIKMSELRALLATQGLSIVDAKDRAVLEAMATVEASTLKCFARANPEEDWGTRWSPLECQIAPAFKAELARRGKP